MDSVLIDEGRNPLLISGEVMQYQICRADLKIYLEDMKKNQPCFRYAYDMVPQNIVPKEVHGFPTKQWELSQFW